MCSAGAASSSCSACFGLIVAITAFFAFRSIAVAKPALPFNRAAVIAGFRGIFADPRAKVCFSAVFCEAIFIHGLFPYVAILLLAAGETRASMAGLVIAAFGLGGVIYSLSVPVLVARISDRRLMIVGGTWRRSGLRSPRCISPGMSRSASSS